MPAAPENSQADAVAALSDPNAYPVTSTAVSVIETHMSWVFLLDEDVYKLKKAIRLDEIDFGTPDRRRDNCLAEVRLNKRLAPDVYLGVIALTRDPSGRLTLGGEGSPVDWVVHMRRLPPERHLEAVIASGRVAAEESRIRDVAERLALFFRSAPAERLVPEEHRQRLREGTFADRRALTETRYGLPADRVHSLAEAQLAFLDSCSHVLDARVASGRLVEGHGDLRPEHIWLDPEPVILDCVEFDRALRIMDPADELAFLALECDRLGAPQVGRWFLEAYVRAAGDQPPDGLLHFYRVYRALRRATIAARHMDDPSVRDHAPFLDRARRYLAMAEPVVCQTGRARL